MSLGHTNICYLRSQDGPGRLWHPVSGCSLGCPSCWARDVVINRLAGTMRGLPADDPFRPTFHPDRLADPLKVRKPSVIGVSFLGDLFDARISNEEIAAVFGVMAATPQHTYIVLTKQARRMRELLSDRRFWCCAIPNAPIGNPPIDPSLDRFIKNVWLGVSVADQADADARIPDLMDCPAAHRWVSYEPARAAVDFDLPACESCGEYAEPGQADDGTPWCLGCDSEMEYPGWLRELDAIIMGGLHAPDAAPMPLDWARRVRDDCAAAGVPFALKQLAGPRPEHWPLLDGVRHADVPWMSGCAHDARPGEE